MKSSQESSGKCKALCCFVLFFGFFFFLRISADDIKWFSGLHIFQRRIKVEREKNLWLFSIFYNCM